MYIYVYICIYIYIYIYGIQNQKDFLSSTFRHLSFPLFQDYFTHKLHLKNPFIIFYVTIKTSYRYKAIGKMYLYNIKIIIAISY